LIVEPASLDDYIEAFKVYPVYIEETLAVLDYSATTFLTLSDIVEGLSVIDTLSSIAEINAGIEEGVAAEDSVNSSLLLLGIIQESIGIIIDESYGGLIISASIIETGIGGTGESKFKRWTGSEWKSIGTVVVYQ
jgi:hypothetical protein